MQPTEAQLAFMNELKAALAKHTNLSGMEMLAVASQFVGNLVALQDQRNWTAEQVMGIVANNIEIGNQAVVEALAKPKGQA